MNTTKNLILAGALLAFGGIAQQAAAARYAHPGQIFVERIGGAPKGKVVTGTLDHGSRISAKGHDGWYDGSLGRFCVTSGAALDFSPIASC